MIISWLVTLIILILQACNLQAFNQGAVSRKLLYEANPTLESPLNISMKSDELCSVFHITKPLPSVLGIFFKGIKIRIFSRKKNFLKPSVHYNNHAKNSTELGGICDILNISQTTLLQYFNGTQQSSMVVVCGNMSERHILLNKSSVFTPKLSVDLFVNGVLSQAYVEFELPLITEKKERREDDSVTIPTNRFVHLKIPIRELKTSIVDFQFRFELAIKTAFERVCLKIYICSAPTLLGASPYKCWISYVKTFNVYSSNNKFETTFSPPFISLANRNNARLKMLLESSGRMEVSMQASQAILSCLSWNQADSHWNGTGCWAITKSHDRLHCACAHMSYFAGFYKFTPKSINLTSSIRILLERQTKMYAVLFMISLWLLFLCFVIITHYYDKIDEMKALPIDLADNSLEHYNIYILVVSTGKYIGAGTVSDVFIKLEGDLSRSNSHKLTCRRYKVLKRSQRNLFIIRTQIPLGDLHHIVVWMDGAQDRWYIKTIQVIDVEAMKVFYFEYETWMSRDQLNCIRQNVSSIGELHTFEALMSNNVCRCFEDINTWLSIVYRPIGSNFSRLQRLSRAFTLLLGSLVVTLMFFDSKLIEEIVTFGKIKLTYVGLTMAFYHLTMLVPITSTTSYLFKCCQHKKPFKFVLPDWRNVEEKTIEDVFKTLERMMKADNLLKNKKQMKERLHSMKRFNHNNNVAKYRTSQIYEKPSLNSPHVASSGSTNWNFLSRTQSETLPHLEKDNLFNTLFGFFPFNMFSKKQDLNSSQSLNNFPLRAKNNSLDNRYIDEYYNYNPLWTYYLAWVLNILVKIIFTFLILLYCLTYTYEVFKQWIVASFVSFLVLVFITNPTSTLLTAFFYSTILVDRFEIPVIHIEDIKREIYQYLRDMSHAEKIGITRRRLGVAHTPIKFGSGYQKKMLKRLQWDNEYWHFKWETIVCMFLAGVFSLTSFMLYDDNSTTTIYYQRIIQRPSIVNNLKIAKKELYWEWMTDILSEVYDHSTSLQGGFSTFIKLPCLHIVQKSENWQHYIKGFGKFDHSTVCLPETFNETKHALAVLKEQNYLHEDVQGVGCVGFLYSFNVDRVVNLFMAVRLPRGGGVHFYSKVTTVDLYYTRKSAFFLLTYIFLSIAVLSLIGVLSRMYTFGFGRFFCHSWNVLLLGVVTFSFGMSLLWSVYLDQWFQTRAQMLQRKDFVFDEFYRMNQLALTPSSFLLILYLWKVTYSLCPHYRFYKHLILIFKTAYIVLLYFFFVQYPIMNGLINSLGLITCSDETTVSALVNSMIWFPSHKPLQTPSFENHSSFILPIKLMLLMSLLVCKFLCIATLWDLKCQFRVLRPASPIHQRYLSYFFTNIKNVKLQIKKEYIWNEIITKSAKMNPRFIKLKKRRHVSLNSVFNTS